MVAQLLIACWICQNHFGTQGSSGPIEGFGGSSGPIEAFGASVLTPIDDDAEGSAGPIDDDAVDFGGSPGPIADALEDDFVVGRSGPMRAGAAFAGGVGPMEIPGRRAGPMEAPFSVFCFFVLGAEESCSC